MRSKLRKLSRIGTPEGRTMYITLRRDYKKNPLKRLNMMGGRNSHIILNTIVRSQNSLKAFIIIKIII